MSIIDKAGQGGNQYSDSMLAYMIFASLRNQFALGVIYLIR